MRAPKPQRGWATRPKPQRGWVTRPTTRRAAATDPRMPRPFSGDGRGLALHAIELWADTRQLPDVTADFVSYARPVAAGLHLRQRKVDVEKAFGLPPYAPRAIPAQSSAGLPTGVPIPTAARRGRPPWIYFRYAGVLLHQLDAHLAYRRGRLLRVTLTRRSPDPGGGRRPLLLSGSRAAFTAPLRGELWKLTTVCAAAAPTPDVPLTLPSPPR